MLIKIGFLFNDAKTEKCQGFSCHIFGCLKWGMALCPHRAESVANCRIFFRLKIRVNKGRAAGASSLQSMLFRPSNICPIFANI